MSPLRSKSSAQSRSETDGSSGKVDRDRDREVELMQTHSLPSPLVVKVTEEVVVDAPASPPSSSSRAPVPPLEGQQRPRGPRPVTRSSDDPYQDDAADDDVLASEAIVHCVSGDCSADTAGKLTTCSCLTGDR